MSDNFTAYPDLFAGAEVCEVCARLIADRRFRSSNWLLLADGNVELLTKEELLKALRDPPVGSLIYVRAGGRRHGFIRALRFSSTSSLVAICGEDEGVILAPRDRLRRLLDLAVRAYERLKRKAPLLEGCEARDWLHEDICKEVEEVRGDPLWRVIVRAL